MTRIKSINLRLEKLREKAARDKEKLDEAATANKMSLVALDKTAAEFRTLHDERQKAMDKWKEAVDLIENRWAHADVSRLLIITNICLTSNLFAQNIWLFRNEDLDDFDFRDAELEDAFRGLAEAKSHTDQAELELKDQTTFLDNEKGNIAELQRNIVDEERRAQVKCSIYFREL